MNNLYIGVEKRNCWKMLLLSQLILHANIILVMLHI